MEPNEQSSPPHTMLLRLFTPTEQLVDEAVAKVIAEAGNGSFCLLPRHVDFVAALVSGILVYTATDGREHLVAIDDGTLVKCGREVRVSVLNAVKGRSPAELRRIPAEQFRIRDEEERRARSALARLEAAALRRFAEIERALHRG